MTNAATSPPICQLVRRPDLLSGILLPRTMTLLTGSPNVGKTAFLAGFLQRFRDGLPIFGRTPAKVPAIGILVADRSWETGTGIWFERAGFPEVRHYCIADDPGFDPRRLRKKFDRTNLFAELVDKMHLPPGSLLAADPLSLWLGGNLNDYDTCLVACSEIRTILRQRDLSLVGPAHTAKLRADPRARYLRAQDQVLGSAALVGFTDTQMYLASPEETEKSTYTLVWCPHQAPVETFELERTSQGLFVPARAEMEREGSIARVLDLIPLDGSAVALGVVVELAKSYPLSDKTVRRALQTLLHQGRIKKIGRGQYCRIRPS